VIRASIQGRLGADPVQRATKTGKPMTTASVAVDVGQPGKEPVTEWINILAFGAVGEALAQHVKGDLIAAMGTLSKSTYVARDGEERSGLSLLAESLLSVRTTYERDAGKPNPTSPIRPCVLRFSQSK
jgi:single-strand DNA-binding protein